MIISWLVLRSSFCPGQGTHQRPSCLQTRWASCPKGAKKIIFCSNFSSSPTLWGLKNTDPRLRGRGGGIPEKFGGGCVTNFPKPSPYSWPKSGIFVLYLWPEQKDIYHQLKARLQKPYPVYDQKWPKSMPHFWPKVLKTLPFRDGHTYIAHICEEVPFWPCLGIRVFALALSEGVTLACMMYILAQKPFSLLPKL